jgi:hypothetical protein
MTGNLFDHSPSDPIPLQPNSKVMHTSDSDEVPVAFGPKTGRSQLGVDFQPSDLSVICGRGKVNYNHTGNRCFRILASVFAQRYSRANSKATKSTLVFNIVTMIRQGGGQFCKYEKGAWFEVGDRCAREKVSTYFRDMLHTQYRSSAKAKTALRRTRNRNRNKSQTQLHDRQLVDGAAGHSDDSSMSSPCSKNSNADSLGFDYSLPIDFFDVGEGATQQHHQQLVDGTAGHSDDSSMSSSCSRTSNTDSLGFDYSLPIDFFDIDVF